MHSIVGPLYLQVMHLWFQPNVVTIFGGEKNLFEHIQTSFSIVISPLAIQCNNYFKGMTVHIYNASSWEASLDYEFQDSLNHTVTETLS